MSVFVLWFTCIGQKVLFEEAAKKGKDVVVLLLVKQLVDVLIARSTNQVTFESGLSSYHSNLIAFKLLILLVLVASVLLMSRLVSFELL